MTRKNMLGVMTVLMFMLKKLIVSEMLNKMISKKLSRMLLSMYSLLFRPITLYSCFLYLVDAFSANNLTMMMRMIAMIHRIPDPKSHMARCVVSSNSWIESNGRLISASASAVI